MQQVVDFFLDNLWLCVGAGVILVVVGDEVLGLSKGMFGDDTDDMSMEPRNRKKRKNRRKKKKDDDDASLVIDDMLNRK
ncbi:MAG: hypothetical protein ACPGGK_11045 [Pikeienuella sp.]